MEYVQGMLARNRRLVHVTPAQNINKITEEGLKGLGRGRIHCQWVDYTGYEDKEKQKFARLTFWKPHKNAALIIDA